MQLVSDFRAAQTAAPTAAPTPPSPPPSAPHQDQAHECCKSSADGDGASQAHADHAILPNTSNLSCPVSAHTPRLLPLPFPAAFPAAGNSRHAPLCARQASSCARQGGKGGGQERGAIERGRERGAGDERGAAQSHTLYTNTVLVRALSCPLSIRMHSYEALLAATAATQASRLLLASSCPADNSTSPIEHMAATTSLTVCVCVFVCVCVCVCGWGGGYGGHGRQHQEATPSEALGTTRPTID